MVDVLGAFLAGLLQGVTEWLPVSSSGQNMLYFLDLLGLDARQAFSFGIFLHLGTTFAVVVKYRHTLAGITKNKSLLKFLVVTAVSGGAVGLVMYMLLKHWLRQGFDGGYMNVMVGGFLVLTGLFLYIGHKRMSGKKRLEDLSLTEQLIVGVAQGFAILPGLSRSAVTVSTLLLTNVEAKEALRLSFLMSIPAVLGAATLDLVTEGVPKVGNTNALVALLTSAAFGYLLIEALLQSSKKIKLHTFCIIFGLIAVIHGILG